MAAVVPPPIAAAFRVPGPRGLGIFSPVRRAAKIDANQPEIVDGLEAIGCSVQSLAAVGSGCPDLLVGFRGANVLLELKVPGEKLNAAQKPWHAQWKGRAYVVWTLQQAIEVVTHYTRGRNEAA